MVWWWQRRHKPAHKIDPATKEEVLRLLAGVQQTRRSRFPALALMVKIGSGYAAMALFTMAALSFSAFTLYGIYNTAREIAYVDLPVVNSLNKLRSSVLAQQNFAGKYAILKDKAFIGLFEQRRQETIANLEVLEKTDAEQDVAALKKLYVDYQKASEALFAGDEAASAVQRALGTRLVNEIDAFSTKQQDVLQALLNRADRLRQDTMKWTVIIACCGFVVAIVAAGVISYRIFRALKRLQTATRHVAAGDYSYDPMIPVGEELSDLASDFKEMAEKLQAIEEARRGDGRPVPAASADGNGTSQS